MKSKWFIPFSWCPAIAFKMLSKCALLVKHHQNGNPSNRAQAWWLSMAFYRCFVMLFDCWADNMGRIIGRSRQTDCWAAGSECNLKLSSGSDMCAICCTDDVSLSDMEASNMSWNIEQFAVLVFTNWRSLYIIETPIQNWTFLFFHFFCTQILTCTFLPLFSSSSGDRDVQISSHCKICHTVKYFSELVSASSRSMILDFRR